MLMTCVHRLNLIKQYFRSENTISVYTCEKHSECVETLLEAETLHRPYACCSSCQDFISSDYITCKNRLAPTGEILNCHCGEDREIFGCKLKGRCVKRLPSGWTAKKLEAYGELTVCRSCDSVG